MSKKMFLTLIVIIVLIVASVSAYYLFLSSSGGTSSGGDSVVTAGVNVGDVFIYQMVGFADSHVEFSVPENFVDVNNTKYYRVEITKVDVPIVSYTVSWEFNNGTAYSYDGMVNIENGVYSGCYWDIYAADLSVGSLSRPDYADDPTITSTQTKLYPDGDREINFISTSYDTYDPTDETYTNFGYVYDYIYFDKQTGMMVAYQTLQIFNYPEIMLTVEYKLVEYTLSGSDTVKVPDSIHFFLNADFEI